MIFFNAEFIFFFDETFILTMNVNSQNNWYWCSKNHGAWPWNWSLLWCYSCQTHVTCIFQRNSKFVPWYLVNSGTTLDEFKRRKKKNIWSLQAWQFCGSHNKPVSGCLKRVICRWMALHGLCHPGLPDRNLCDYFLWNTLKDKFYVNSPHSLNNRRMILKESLPIFEDKKSVMC